MFYTCIGIKYNKPELTFKQYVYNKEESDSEL